MLTLFSFFYLFNMDPETEEDYQEGSGVATEEDYQEGSGVATEEDYSY